MGGAPSPLRVDGWVRRPRCVWMGGCADPAAGRRPRYGRPFRWLCRAGPSHDDVKGHKPFRYVTTMCLTMLLCRRFSGV
jgi:hypothetical protein